MNSRPLTYVSTSSGDVEPLTPSHLLYLRGGAGPIPGDYTESDTLSRRRWRHVQYLAQQFWYRWKREYLLSLQLRQKWTRESRNVRLGVIVLLADQEVPRGRWRMGRVVEAFPSRDGLVRKARVKAAESTYLRPRGRRGMTPRRGKTPHQNISEFKKFLGKNSAVVNKQ